MRLERNQRGDNIENGSTQACGISRRPSREMIARAGGRDAAKRQTKLDFEKAAELRNMLDDLRRTTKPMRRFTRHSLPTHNRSARRRAGIGRGAAAAAPPNVMECFDISNISHHARGRVDGFLPRRRSRTRTTTAVIAFARSRGRMILRAWQKSCGADIRACFCEAREAESRRRRSIRRRIPVEALSSARDDKFVAGAPARPDHRRWRQGPAFLRLSGVTAARSARCSDHRPGQGV